jgi:hypothetical protein
MTREELTDQVCKAASDILGKEVKAGRLDIGTRGLIAVLSDDTPFKMESHPQEDTVDDTAPPETAQPPDDEAK